MYFRKTDHKELKKTFMYDPFNGILYRKHQLGGNVPLIPAGWVHNIGYRLVKIKGVKLLYHRVIWSWVHGYSPENPIDHINRDKLDNKLDNLREISFSCNSRNSRLYSNNTSGVTGVCFNRHKNKWRADVRVNHVNKTIGVCKSFEEAVCHRLAAEQALEWDGCDSSSPAYKYVKTKVQHAL